MIQSRKSSFVHGAEPARVRKESVGEHTAHAGGHHRDEMPGAAHVGVLVDEVVQCLAGIGERAVEGGDRAVGCRTSMPPSSSIFANCDRRHPSKSSR
jgi:hypothetical protein